MQAKKCDRCGKFYTENKNKYEKGSYCANRILVFAGRHIFCEYDLCDGCVNKLMEFLNKEGDNNA